MNFNIKILMINRKSIVNSPDDRLRQFNRMPIPMIYQRKPLEFHILQVMISYFKPRKFEGASLNTFLVIAI